MFTTKSIKKIININKEDSNNKKNYYYSVCFSYPWHLNRFLVWILLNKKCSLWRIHKDKLFLFFCIFDKHIFHFYSDDDSWSFLLLGLDIQESFSIQKKILDMKASSRITNFIDWVTLQIKLIDDISLMLSFTLRAYFVDEQSYCLRIIS